MLTLQFGVFNMYTFLDSLTIVPLGANATIPCGSPVMPFNTTTLTTAPGNAFSASTSLSGGAITGIVIGLLLGLAAITAVVLLVRHRMASEEQGIAYKPMSSK